MVSLEWKCALGNAVATVLVYVVLVSMLGASNRPYQQEQEWWKSLEFLMLASAVVAYNVNANFFMTNCMNS